MWRQAGIPYDGCIPVMTLPAASEQDAAHSPHSRPTALGARAAPARRTWRKWTGWPAGAWGVLWPGTVMLAALLTLSIQPLFARLLLPQMGGAPAVWVVALLFFQTALLAGYAYAHLLSRLRPLGAQVIVHLGVLALAAAWLPPALHWTPSATQPVLDTVLGLAGGVGPPYIVLVATAPLLQHWFARARAASDPYVLYAASNGGSLAGLLVYPFLVEPLLGLRTQSWVWAAAYGACALLIAGCGLLATRQARRLDRRPDVAAAPVSPATRVEPVRYLRWIGLAALPTAWLGAVSTYLTVAVAPVPLLWVLPLAAYLLTLILAFAPSTPWRGQWLARFPDVAALAGFIRARPRLVTRLTIAAAAVAVAVRALEPAPLVVFVHLAALFGGALACHVCLAADRPSPSGLTAYYLALAAGGALGGAFSAIVAPLLFPTVLEYPLVLAACWATGLVRPTLAGPANGRHQGTEAGDRGAEQRPSEPESAGGSPARQGWLAGQSGRDRQHPGALASFVRASVPAVSAMWLAGSVAFGAPHWFLVPILLGTAVLLTLGAARLPWLAAATLLAVLIVADGAPVAAGYRQERVARSFFGVSRVISSPGGAQRILLHGLVSHGSQLLDPALSGEPRGYYSREGPLGDILGMQPAGDAAALGNTGNQGGTQTGGATKVERVGVVGLGAGAIACYADARRRVTFYEIDPVVIAIAQDRSLFTYLSGCPPEAVVLGDGRLSLQQERNGSFDVLIVDAYSGDTMPLHLLTREAFALYGRVLAPHGVLALHISNNFFDLEPLVAALAGDAGLAARLREDGVAEAADAAVQHLPGWAPSVWALVGHDADMGDRLSDTQGWRPLRPRRSFRVWTDDYANPLAIRR